jgi:hypothetical protein
MNQPRCPACGSYRLTPRTRVCPAHVGTATGDRDQTVLQYEDPHGGLLSHGIRLSLTGSACLDCGHVLLFLDDEALARARTMPAFRPIL